jgi:protein transport protein SEC23
MSGNSEFLELEEVDGVRMVWNVWPKSRLEAAKCVVPFGVVVTPAKQTANLQVVEYDPVLCKSCGGVLNPYAMVDFAGKVWTCPFCMSRNHFPAHYQGISEASVPAELFPQCSTIEYNLVHSQHRVANNPPAYVFVIDTCVAEDELKACTTAVAQAMTMIPEYALVGLVTFGTHVYVHELGFQEFPKTYVFKGSKSYTPGAVHEQLGLLHQHQGGAGRGQQPVSRKGAFLMPFGECEFVLSAALEDLQCDAFPAVTGQRPARCTGTALQVATALMGGSLPSGGGAARMLLMLGGPCTEGEGKVVDKDLTEPIRSHKDLAKDSAPHYRRAKAYYDGIATQLVLQGHTLDLYACALDQVGLAEMKTAVEATGGISIQTDTFTNPVFKQSLKRMFIPPGEAEHLPMHSNATMETFCSKDIKVCGALGPASGVDGKKSPLISDTIVGLGGTTTWKLCSLEPGTSMAVIYDIVAPHGSNDVHQGQNQFFLQFVTRYLHENGTMRCRVTTVTRRWVDGSHAGDLIQGFDQECAAVLVARLASYKMEVEEDFDATRWLDRSLIRVASRFGDYRKDEPESFQLQPQLAFYPQFMFHFRRSPFVQVFGQSPDETAYSRMLLNREVVSEATLMLQPLLYAYSFNSQAPEPVLLDVTSVTPDRILLLDAYFYVVVFHGSTVAQWRKAGYQRQPEHAAFKALLEAPQGEAASIIRRRFPTPRFTDCDQNGSQARFLLAKLNPSATYNSTAAVSSEVIMTDDVSLQVFTEHLKKLAVQS